MVDNEINKMLYRQLKFIEDYIKQFTQHSYLDHNQRKLLMEVYKNIELVKHSLESEGD